MSDNEISYAVADADEGGNLRYWCPGVNQYQTFALELHGTADQAVIAARRHAGRLLTQMGAGKRAVILEVTLREVGHVDLSAQVTFTDELRGREPAK